MPELWALLLEGCACCEMLPEQPGAAIPCSTGWFYPCDPGGIGRGCSASAENPLSSILGAPTVTLGRCALLSPAGWQGQEGKSCPALFSARQRRGLELPTPGHHVQVLPCPGCPGIPWGGEKGMGMEGWRSMFCRPWSTVSSPEQELSPQKLRRDSAAFPPRQLHQERFPPRLPRLGAPNPS